MCERAEPVIPCFSTACDSLMAMACAHARSEVRRRRLTNLPHCQPVLFASNSLRSCIILMISCDVFRCNGSFRAVLCAGFGRQTQFLAQVVDSVGELCSVGSIITKVLRLDAPRYDKSCYLHFGELWAVQRGRMRFVVNCS